MNITLWQQQMIQVFRSVVTILSRCWQKCVAVVRRFVVRVPVPRGRVRQQVEVTPEQLARLERSHASLCEYYRRLLMMRGAWRVWFMQWPVQI